MEANDVHELIRKYNEGLASPSEVSQIEQMLEDGLVDLSRLSEIADLHGRVLNMDDPTPPAAVDDTFYQFLSAQLKAGKRFTFSFHMPELAILLPRLAFGVVLLITGFAGGYWMNKPAPPSDQVQALSREVGDLKEMVMLSLLEKESASERLRAVSLTSDMDQASKKVTTALLQTLNHDANVNVRLAALDALRPYVRENSVRAELIRAISKQDSPILQVALAELMRDIQEKRSVSEFNKILKGDKTPEDVKSRIREKIQVLI